MLHWSEYDYSELSNILCFKKCGVKQDGSTYNDIYIMADTETSKKQPDAVEYKYNKTYNITQKTYKGTDNHIVAWSIALRAFDTNIVTLWGRHPSSFIKCVNAIHEALPGDKTILYFHNYPYDYVFLRMFFIENWGKPVKVLNVKPHYPILMTFRNGIIIKDSLILAQRKLEKWADDLEVEHKKAVGSWEYDKLRNQNEDYTHDELTYIEHDVLAGVECLNKTADTLQKRVYTLPYTATGIPREQVKKRGKKVHAHDAFKRQAPNYEIYKILENVYHGGYTHTNRHLLETILPATCYDLASSYPYQMLTMKAPAEQFTALNKKVKKDYILKNSENYAFIFKFTLYKFRLKNSYWGMPPLQFSKCLKTVNCVQDNGRIICGAYAEIYLNEDDLFLIDKYYQMKGNICTEVYYAYKDYLPRWFTDYVYNCFKEKTLKKKDKNHPENYDPVAYSIAKATVNSLYGMCCMKNVKIPILEDYQTGEYNESKDVNAEDLYNKYVNNYETVLPYAWGVWVTSGALIRLYALGECVADGEQWIYSDTDSCYATGWNMEKLQAFNQEAIDKLKSRGYDAVVFNDREYWTGIAECDAEEDEHPAFVSVGAKRYAYINKDCSLHTTVAGVPKEPGAKVLEKAGGLEKFKPGFVFDGESTGKLMHTYLYNNKIYVDKDGNETADSINLSPCDYLLSSVHVVDWEQFFEEEIMIQVYDEEDY